MLNPDAVPVMFVPTSVGVPRLPPTVARVPVVGRLTLVAPVAVSVVENAPEVARVEPVPRVSVPLPAVIVLPLIVLFVKASDPARVARVPVVGSTTVPDPATA